MASKVDALRSQLLALPEGDRAGLAMDLLDSIDDRAPRVGDAELDRVWAQETARRAEQIDSGEIETDTWEDVLDKVAESRKNL